MRDLAVGASRFSELHRGVPLMSPTLLSRRLKQLEAEGVVERRRSPRGKSWTYHLTDAGREFAPLVEALGVWGQRWSRRQLAEGEVDLGLLIWSLERSIEPDAFGGTRTVVRLQLTDQPAAKALWWFINQDSRCELCLEGPGFEVDLYLECSLVNMIYIVRGDLPLEEARHRGRLEAIGSAKAPRGLARWLNLSPLAGIRSQRADAAARPC